jgi:outer membrane protein assembly factor BamD (BamD/ComL family)
VLRDEIRLLDRARAALRMRAPQQALQELRHYFDGHPHGMLEPEAAVLRIEALRENGDRVQAAAASREFLARHPDGPLADRVRRLAEK